jgi:hypothetical protein
MLLRAFVMKRSSAEAAALAIAIAAWGCAGERGPQRVAVDAHAGDRDSHQAGAATHTTGFENMSTSQRRDGRATGRTIVKVYEQTTFDEAPEGPSLAEIHVAETFSGDLEGDGIVHGVQAARHDGSSTFVGIERFRGDLRGQKGTFLLHVRRTVVGKEATGEWFVMPGSATGELRGLRGDGGFKAELGQHGTIWLDYFFEATR